MTNLKNKKGQTVWTLEMHRIILQRLKDGYISKDFDLLLTEICQEAGVKLSSLRRAIGNYKYAAGYGKENSSHTPKAGEQAVKEFIEANGTKLFRIL